MAPMIDDDFIGTLSDSDEVSDEEALVRSIPSVNGTKRKLDVKKQSAVKKQKTDNEPKGDEDVDSDFEFGLEAGLAQLDDYEAFVGDVDLSSRRAIDIDAIAARRRHRLAADDFEEGKDEEQSEDSFDRLGGGADMAEEEEEESGSEDESTSIQSANDAEDEDGERITVSTTSRKTPARSVPQNVWKFEFA